MINATSFSPDASANLFSVQSPSPVPSGVVQSNSVQSNSVQSSSVQAVQLAFEILQPADPLESLASRPIESSLGELSAERDEPVAQREAKEPPAASLSQGSSIATFRDHATGVLVIKLVGRRNNEVLAQFPTPMQLSNYPKISSFAAPPSSLREMT